MIAVPVMLCVQDSLRESWIGLNTFQDIDAGDNRFSDASCQPRYPTSLPPYFPDCNINKLLPIWKVKGAVWGDTGCWALTYIPAVAARMSDVVGTAKGHCKQLNLTPEQWQLVRTCNTHGAGTCLNGFDRMD
jgi:hypothetical protein